MFGQSYDRSVLRRFVLVLTVVLAAGRCATSRSRCMPTEHGWVFHAVRGSGGAVLTGAEFGVATGLTYDDSQRRCASLAPADVGMVRAVLQSPRLTAILSDISSKQYQLQYSDSPHVVLDTGSGAVFIPAYLLIEGELRELLRPLDDLFRERFGRGYRLPLLPTFKENEDLKRIWRR